MQKRLKQRTDRRYGLILLMAALLLSVFTAIQARAQSTASLQLTGGIAGSTFSLYQVGTLDGEDALTISDAFQTYAARAGLSSLTTGSNSAMKSAADTLVAYIAADSVKATATAKADTDGNVSFSDLAAGLYLISGETVTSGTTQTVQGPNMLFITAEQADAGETIPAAVKSESNEIPVSITVKKYWSGDSSSDRPDSITVQLVHTVDSEKTTENVKLTADNNWTYTWSNLKQTGTYSVVEVTSLSGYTTSITHTSSSTASTAAQTWAITNKKSSSSSGSKSSSSSSSGSSTSSKSSGSGSSSLPQTGQLWWPVSILAVLGILCVAIGLMRRKTAKGDTRN